MLFSLLSQLVNGYKAFVTVLAFECTLAVCLDVAIEMMSREHFAADRALFLRLVYSQVLY